MKTRKFIQKRIKKTKNGKILTRTVQQDHFLAKKSGDAIRQKRKMRIAGKVLAKLIKINI